MTRAAAGIYIKNHLYGAALADIIRIAEAGVKDHETRGCRFAEGWQARLETKLLEVLPDIIGDFLERPNIEVYCPNRDVEVKEAA